MAFERKIWSAARRIWVGALPSPAQRAVGGLAYASLVFVSLGVSSIIWAAVAVDKLFVCTDSTGALDFIPPFVHDCCGDHYVASPLLVWTFWGSLVAGSFALPIVVVLLAGHLCNLISPGKQPPTD